MVRTLLIFAVLVVLCCPLHAGERPFIPAKEPIVACFIPQLDVVERIASTQILTAARLSESDFPLRLPGLGKVPSVRTFFDQLNRTQAERFWLCMPDLTRAAMGWTWPNQEAAQETVEMFLDQSGIDSQKVHIQIDETGDRKLHILVASNPAIAAVMTEPASASNTRHPWRESFAETMSLTDGIGLWLNSRQLSGMLAMLSGIDIRPLFRNADIDFPAAVTVRLDENENTLGLSLALHGNFASLLSAGEQKESVLFYGYQQEPPIRLDMHFDSPDRLLPLVQRIPPLPGVDFAKFIPTDASMGIWSDSFGKLSASMSVAFRPGVRLAKDFVKLGSLLATFFSFPDFTIRVEVMPDAPWIKLSNADATLALLLAPDNNGRDVLHLFTGEYTDMAYSLDVRNNTMSGGSTLNWRIALDPDMRKTATDILSSNAAKVLPFNPGVTFWAIMTGTEEVGTLGLESDRLYMESPKGGILWLGLGAWSEIRSRIKPLVGNSQTVLAAKRLRFLLNAANQSRYRQITAKNRKQTPLPATLSQISFAGSDGKAWLDNSLPPFPGFGKPNYRPLQQIAEGSAMDGYSYAIEATAGNWAITATPKSPSLPSLRIDASGKVMERTAISVWQPRQVVLADLF